MMSDRPNVLVIPADHGDLMGDFGTYFKACQQQGSVRAPRVILGPRMPADGRWKYAYAQQGAVEELYDLGEDPHEPANLAAVPDPDRAAFRDLPVRGMGWRWYWCPGTSQCATVSGIRNGSVEGRAEPSTGEIRRPPPDGRALAAVRYPPCLGGACAHSSAMRRWALRQNACRSASRGRRTSRLIVPV
jgi:hypothetical protein